MKQTLLKKTRDHYDGHPFIKGGENRVDWWRRYLLDFLPDEDIRDRLIVDVGSSVGEISRGLNDRGARMVCLDVSLQSLRVCRQVNLESPIFHGNALELPFADESFDHAISIGVLHHTPNCREGFREIARVTAPGGKIVIFLYNYWNIYNPIYHAFKPLRALMPLDRVPPWVVRMLQPFARSHLGQSLDDEQLRNLLGDKLWTPMATFHSVAQITRWGKEELLDLLGTKKFYLGYANVFLFRKRGKSRGGRRERPRLRCVACGGTEVREEDTGFVCTRCGNTYSDEDGIYRCIAG